ncbi:MAG TPA: argininosuccinate lyase [Actinopolymorphaceae bacterium]|jgi:argininosuccinate lyase|nr:argininosuccinate lyase [Actinopolymorphaceae bacterium]
MSTAHDQEPRGISDGQILVNLNKAQLVMLDEQGLLAPDLVRRLADATATIEPDWPPSAGDYLAIESELVRRIGAEASNLHLGRSRNDIGATRERIWLKDAFFAALGRLLDARRLLLARVGDHADVVIPSYTHAVQAQPISLGHYLLALDAALDRDSSRLLDAYARIDRSPLGAGALATSGFALDRRRLAELLGFSDLCENSYDCIGVASADTKLELAQVFATSAIGIGRFCSDLVTQHASPTPGLTVSSEFTGGSSIMPQKRNPAVLERLRNVSSRVVGAAAKVTFVAHNTPFGDVADVRGIALAEALDVTELATAMYAALADLMTGLIVDAAAFERLVQSDYSTMTELADTLFREAGVPFRVGHAYAKRVTEFGRGRMVGPRELQLADLDRLYHEETGEPFPLDVTAYQRAVDPAEFVRSRTGVGGPQPVEVARMLSEHRRALAELDAWRTGELGRLAAAADDLAAAFAARCTAGATRSG